MDIKEFRESGLLELYLIGACNDAEKAEVEKALDQYPELQKDIAEISKSLEKYGAIQGHQPSAGLKEKILDAASSSSQQTVNNLNRPWSSSGLLTTLLGLATVILGSLVIYLNSQLSNSQAQIKELELECDSIQQNMQLQYAWMNDIQDSNSEWIELTATDKYSETDIVLVHNDALKKNYLQLKNLPPINANQSYQLWSLKPDIAPIPLTVFQGDEGVFVPVDFEDGTQTYAITIEPFGGLDSPTLSNLLGTMSI